MFRIRSIAVAAAFAVFVVANQIQPVAAAYTEVDKIEGFAAAQLNKPFEMGATGLRRYDCSGLVYRTYYEEGLLGRIGGRDRRANGYYKWFKSRGLITSNPKPGDLVVFAYRGYKVSHIGIFVGYNRRGQAMAISALINPYGVTRHRVNGIRIPFKAYLSVNLTR